MGSRRLIQIMVYVGLALAIPVLTSAQPEAPPVAPPLSAAQSQPTDPTFYLLPTDPNEKISTWRNLCLRFYASNGSENYIVETVSLYTPQGIAVKAMDKQINPDGTVVLLNSSMELSKPYEYRLLESVELKPKPLGELGSQFWEVLTYRPRKEAFKVVTQFRPNLPENLPRQSTQELVLNVEAHPLGMYTGAVVGAFLSALLSATIAIRRRYASFQDSHDIPGRGRLSLNFLLSFFTGVVASAIAILLFQTTSSMDFAVAITVKDFYGGVLLGLFGDKVAMSIYQKVTTSLEPSPKDRPEGAQVVQAEGG